MVQSTFQARLIQRRQLRISSAEIKTVFKPGKAFVEGANEPHYVENIGEEATIVWVTVASVEGMPTTEFINE